MTLAEMHEGGSMLDHPRFESFAVESHETADALRVLVRKNLGAEWRIEKLAENLYEAFNPAYLKSEWEARRLHEHGVIPERASSELPPAKAWEIARRLSRKESVLSAEPLFSWYVESPDLIAREAGDLPEGASDCEWSLRNARIFDAWEYSKTNGRASFGLGVVIGHPDTGYQHHDELNIGRLRLNEDRDLVDDDDDALDPLDDGFLRFPGHGTGTGSVIISDAGRKLRPNWVSGVAPDAELIPLRVSPSVALFSTRNLVRALYYAADRRCHVVSVSMGGLGSRTLRRAVRDVTSRGVIVVAAAGNRVRFVVHPAAYDEVVGCAATNARDLPWSGSSRGRGVDIAAPGESVWRAWVRYEAGLLQTGVSPSSGTSFSTAITAGIAALWLAHHGRNRLIDIAGGPDQLTALFCRILQATARKPGSWNGDFGAGIVDALALLRADPAAFSGERPAATRATNADEILEQLASMLDASPRAAAHAIAELLRCEDVENDLGELGGELLQKIALDSNLFSAIRESVAVSVTRAGTSSIAVARETLARHDLSRALRSRVDPYS